jgi:outer membrane protein assembly factor BamB
VFTDSGVLVATGQDPEHGEGTGALYLVNPGKRGDVSTEMMEQGAVQPNENSGLVWEHGRLGRFHRTLSSAAIVEGLVFAADFSGYVYCLDLKTGTEYWSDDLLSGVWSSPIVVDGKVLIGNEDGALCVYEASRKKQLLARLEFGSSIHGTPAFANGVLYVPTRSKLIAVRK